MSSRTVYAGRVFSVRRDRVIEPGGVEATRDVVVHPGSVVVMPVFPGGRILMIRQYRHSVGRFLWELVAGRIDRGESPLTAARRELAEETGYTARRYRKLMDLFPTPGFVTERMVVFAAEGLREGQARPEEDERITSRIVKLHEAEKWIRTGKIRDAKSVAAILYYLRFHR
ncbi:MAG: NUDIX hydrolase [Candidatus Acidiferrales bacterium]